MAGLDAVDAVNDGEAAAAFAGACAADVVGVDVAAGFEAVGELCEEAAVAVGEKGFREG